MDKIQKQRWIIWIDMKNEMCSLEKQKAKSVMKSSLGAVLSISQD